MLSCSAEYWYQTYITYFIYVYIYIYVFKELTNCISQLEMDETIQNLQDNMNKMNLNLLTTVKRLEDKEKLMQNLQSEVGKLRRQLESEVIERF